MLGAVTIHETDEVRHEGQSVVTWILFASAVQHSIEGSLRDAVYGFEKMPGRG